MDLGEGDERKGYQSRGNFTLIIDAGHIIFIECISYFLLHYNRVTNIKYSCKLFDDRMEFVSVIQCVDTHPASIIFNHRRFMEYSCDNPLGFNVTSSDSSGYNLEPVATANEW